MDSGSNSPPGPISIVQFVLGQAERAFVADDLETARDHYLKVLRMEPHNPVARMAVDEIERDLKVRENYQRELIEGSRILRVAPARQASVAETMPPTEELVLSRISSKELTIDELLESCESPEPVVLIVLQRLLQRGIVQLA